MDAIVLCGIQASGKSTYVRHHWFDTHVRINRDMLGTRNREDIVLHACLAAQARLVVDNTNPKRAQRERYLRLARAAGYEQVVVYFFDVSVDEALERNQGRPEGARVPDLAIRGTANKLERPSLEEGWDEAFVVHVGSDGGFVVEKLG